MRKLCSATPDLARRLLSLLASAIAYLPRQAAKVLEPQAGIGAKRHRRLWLALTVACPAALVASIMMPRLTIVMSPSIEAWIVTERAGPIARGDYVRFALSHPIAGPRPVQVTKHALCLPGDRFSIEERPSSLMGGERDGWYYCNGSLLGVSLPRAHNGMRLEHFHWSGIIPPGLAYVGSTHPRGFDSRYIGLVPILHLTRMERLL
jgi:type IV secretory pathway protease TraF